MYICILRMKTEKTQEYHSENQENRKTIKNRRQRKRNFKTKYLEDEQHKGKI